jgi:hypothetical protein
MTYFLFNKKFIIIKVYYYCRILCVSHTIVSAPGLNLRPVSLEPSGPEPAIFKKKKIFPKSDQWPNDGRKSLRLQCFSMAKIERILFSYLKSNFFSKH